MSDRPVHTDALATLGTVIDNTQQRDAIHLAVIPMRAKHRMRPGAPVDEDGDLASGNPVGIVDPFLEADIEAGQWFWCVIRPRVITSLRHVWSHPRFDDEQQRVGPGAVIESPSAKAVSEAWMREWALEHMSADYYGHGDSVDDRLSVERAYANAIDAGRTHRLGRYEDAKDHIDETWWRHWETITGERGDREAYFSCAC